MNYSYKTFQELESCPLIATGKCDVCSQGFKYAYDVICLGTGNNDYIISLTSLENKKQFEFSTSDKFIRTWTLRSHLECLDGKEFEDFRFNAFGSLIPSQTKSPIYGFLDINRHKSSFINDIYQVDKISVYNASPNKLPKIPDNENMFCETILETNTKHIEDFKRENSIDDE